MSDRPAAGRRRAMGRRGGPECAPGLGMGYLVKGGKHKYHDCRMDLRELERLSPESFPRPACPTSKRPFLAGFRIDERWSTSPCLMGSDVAERRLAIRNLEVRWRRRQHQAGGRRPH